MKYFILQYHEKNCSDRFNVESYLGKKATASSKTESSLSLAQSFETTADMSNMSSFHDEDWDDDANHRSYNPRKKCQSSDTIVNIAHGCPSQRKDRREAERRRLNELRND